MDDESKKNGNEENEEKEGFFKRVFGSAKNRVRIAGAVYAFLAICVVTVMILSVTSITGSPSVDIDVSLPEISVPSVIDYQPRDNEKPVQKEESNVPSDTEEPTEDEEVYYRPSDGETLKGYRMNSLIYSKTMKDYRTHSGIDISASVGSEVRCYADGVVSEVADDPFMGKTVKVTHEYGLVSVYQNLMDELPDTVRVGSSVKAGDIIGAVGESAIMESADEPHLHFELLLDGKHIDCEKELEISVIKK